jgi:hypothetical protein
MAKAVLREEFGCNVLTIYCQACNDNHSFLVDFKENFKYNQDEHYPTVEGIIHQESIVQPSARQNHCSFSLKNGMIHYLHSCKHAFHGRSVELQDYND